MKQLIYFIISALLTFNFFACSEEDLSVFQDNDPEPEYRLFSLLDDYPALKSLTDNIDSVEFNYRTADFVAANRSKLITLLEKTDQLIGSNPGHDDRPVTNSITLYRTLIDRIMQQDDFRYESVKEYPGTPANNIDSFYGFLDKVRDSDIEVSSNLIVALNKVLGYIYATKSERDIEETIEDFIIDLRDTGDGSLISDLQDTLKDAGDLLLKPNEDLWLDRDTDEIITDRSSIDTTEGTGDTDTGLGNAVRGVDVYLSGLSDLSQDVTIRDDVYDLLRKALTIPSLTVSNSSGSKTIDQVLMQLIVNLEEYFTITTPGESLANDYDSASDYNSSYVGTSDPLHTSGAADPRYYINTEMGNSLKELFPAIIKLFIRADRDDAGIVDAQNADYFDTDGDTYGNAGVYPLELLSKALYNADIDVANSNIEDIILKFIKYDGQGRDRTDPASGAYGMSMLDQLLFLFAALRDIGFKDRETSNISITGNISNGSSTVSSLSSTTGLNAGNFIYATGVPLGTSIVSINGTTLTMSANATATTTGVAITVKDAEGLLNHGHGHGESTGGVLTINDALFNMGTGELLGMDAYVLALKRPVDKDPAGKFMHRSNAPFDDSSFTFTADSPYGGHPFLMDTNFPALQLMPSHLAGDAGLPTGGNGVNSVSESGPVDSNNGNNWWNTYVGRTNDEQGIGDTNTARWMLGMLARTLWRGEGPYHFGSTCPSGEPYGAKYQSEWTTDYYLIEMGLINAKGAYGTDTNSLQYPAVTPGTVDIYLGAAAATPATVIGNDSVNCPIDLAGLVNGASASGATTMAVDNFADSAETYQER